MTLSLFKEKPISHLLHFPTLEICYANISERALFITKIRSRWIKWLLINTVERCFHELTSTIQQSIFNLWDVDARTHSCRWFITDLQRYFKNGKEGEGRKIGKRVVERAEGSGRWSCLLMAYSCSNCSCPAMSIRLLIKIKETAVSRRAARLMYSRAHVKVKVAPVRRAHDRTHETLSLRRPCTYRRISIGLHSLSVERPKAEGKVVVSRFSRNCDLCCGQRAIARALSLRLWRLERNWRRSRQRIINSFMYAERARACYTFKSLHCQAIRALRARETNALPSK